MSAGRPIQLPLGIKLRDEATFASYYPGPNAGVLAATQAFAEPQSSVEECCLYLWGSEGTGRTHLLQAACHALADVGGRCICHWMSLQTRGRCCWRAWSR